MEKVIIGSINIGNTEDIPHYLRALIVYDVQSNQITVGDDIIEGKFKNEQEAREDIATMYQPKCWDFVEVVEPLPYTDQDLYFIDI
jgi:hypothetical protein